MTAIKLALAALVVAGATTSALANGQFIGKFSRSAAYDGHRMTTVTAPAAQIVVPPGETRNR
jgi:hypothetical protein